MGFLSMGWVWQSLSLNLSFEGGKHEEKAGGSDILKEVGGVCTCMCVHS